MIETIVVVGRAIATEQYYYKFENLLLPKYFCPSLVWDGNQLTRNNQEEDAADFFFYVFSKMLGAFFFFRLSVKYRVAEAR